MDPIRLVPPAPSGWRHRRLALQQRFWLAVAARVPIGSRAGRLAGRLVAARLRRLKGRQGGLAAWAEVAARIRHATASDTGRRLHDRGHPTTTAHDHVFDGTVWDHGGPAPFYVYWNSTYLGHNHLDAPTSM